MTYVFDDYGNLNGGIIESNINDIKLNLVNSFNTSKTRERNFNSLLELVNFLKREDLLNGVSRIWIDGSFCTKKINPNDLDLIILLKPYSNSAKILQKNSALIRKNYLDKHLDVYMVYDSKCFDNLNYMEQIILNFNSLGYSEDEIKNILCKSHQEVDYHMKYWMGQFGFDRNQRSKGLISLEGGCL